MDKNNSIVPYANPVKDMNYKIPEPTSNTHITHINRIRKAYNSTVYFDDSGVMWIQATKLAEIIRTNKVNAQYIISNNISDDAKVYSNNELYIRGYEIKGLIEKAIEESGVGTKRQYLKYSEKLFNAIRDCDNAENIRTIYHNQLQSDIKKLKNKRIRKYGIKFDELTGEKLKRLSAEFSHIRSYALFKSISDNIENGLIVNKEVHKIITKRGINDERELLELCEEMGWNTDWYNKYKIYFFC